MAREESNITNLIMKAASKLGDRLFRVNTGMAWVGQPLKGIIGQTVRLMPGDIVLRHARPIRMGLVNGGSDLIGWRSVIITPDMVGKKLAIFLAPEIKTATGRLRPEQHNFIRVVNEAGGKAFVCRSADEYETLANK